MKKIELVDDWKKAPKFWSVITSFIGTCIMGFFTIWPESALYLWGAMPNEVKTLLPDQLATGIAMFIFIASMISRLIKQKNV